MSKIVLVIFRVFKRNRREHLKLSYLAIFLFVILLLKFQIKDGFSVNITSSQKCRTNEFLYLENIISCHYIQHIRLHQNLVCLIITYLKCKDYNNLFQ